MKRSIIILICTAMSVSFALAQQGRGKFNPQEFKAKLESYVTREAGFTQNEAQAFYPIYFEMKGKQRGLQRKIFQLKQNASTANTSDNDYAATIQKIKDLGVEMAQLEVTYYKKMCKAISPKKVYLAMLAEDEFHRQMLRRFNREKEGPDRRNNHKGNQRKPNGER